MAAKSAEAQLRKAVIAALKAAGLPVSKDVRVFPRVELTDVQESGAIDKGEDVRELGFVVEAISLSAYEEAATLSETAETALVGQDTVTMPRSSRSEMPTSSSYGAGRSTAPM